MSADQLFTPADREAIAAAVTAAEKRTSGEIVVSVVAACDEYAHAHWKAATLGSLFAALGAAALHDIGGHWGGPLGFWMALPAAGGAALGFLLARWPAVRRFLATPEVMVRRVHTAAAHAFLDGEVFRTRERTGILLFVALFEHRVEVVGDSGIRAKVAQEEWEGIVRGVVTGMREGRSVAALVEGIRQCGELLERHGVLRRPDDVNELPDGVRSEKP
jgi:putative membrane protein